MFKIFYLSKCIHSKNAIQTLNKYNLVTKSNIINCDNKNNFTSDPTHTVVPSEYLTYPKIIYMLEENVFVGGNDELVKLISVLTDKKSLDKIPSQRFIDRKNTCKILLNLSDKIK